MRWVGGRSHGLRGPARGGPHYRDGVPSIRKPFAALASRAVHGIWRRAQYAGAISAERPGPYAFRRIGTGTRLAFPQGTVFGTPWIELGDHCVVGQEVTLAAGMLPGLDLGPEALLTLGNGVVLGRGSHVIADVQGAVTFGDDVYCGPYVYITSTNHSYDDPHEPVGKQWPRSAAVEIGSGSWLGAGAVILPGARLGRNVVVAAGSVVRGEVPGHAVVAGAPARIVRRWEGERGWQPPLRTPAPAPVPDGVTPQQLLAASELAAGEGE
ncbi:acyltransferase [Streptomyces winkii]|uniref:acyltransferase n=1 Tax=Streptomyces winkii TaxID=3051178 RepID=UPI0028D62846|nr:acyltransferase [Streptomyces sp. DSM 40971]